ncbi:MAG: hypothetical protein COA79_22190 [Planctomycetota bacterium]|nr:MAG: hypothetical protein COA79_22190 [Planctomycetota bacterium]
MKIGLAIGGTVLLALCICIGYFLNVINSNQNSNYQVTRELVKSDNNEDSVPNNSDKSVETTLDTPVKASNKIEIPLAKKDDKSLVVQKQPVNIVNTKTLKEKTKIIKFTSILTITLIDRETKAILQNTKGRVSLKLNHRAVTTSHFESDNYGLVTIQIDGKGDCFILVDVKGYTVKQIYKSIKQKSELAVASLSKGGGRLNITAIDQEGNFLENIDVKISGRKRQIDQEVNPFDYQYNNYSNQHEYSDLSIGLNEIIVEADGFMRSEKFLVEVSYNEIAELNVQLKPSPKLVFSLFGAKPLPNKLKIQAYVDNGVSRYYRRSISHVYSEDIFRNSKNQYVFNKKNDSIFSLKIIANNYQPVTLIIDKDKVSYDVYLKRGVKYKLLVLDERKKPLSGIEIKYTTDKVQNSVMTNSAGEAFFNSVIPDKSLYVVIRLKGYFAYHKYTKQLKMEGHDEKGFVDEVILKKSLSIEGTVTFDAKEIPFANVTLNKKNVRRGSPSRRMITADENGHFSFEGLKTGTYFLSARHQSHGFSEKQKVIVKNGLEIVTIELKSRQSYEIKFHLNDETPFKLKTISLTGNGKSTQLTTDDNGVLLLKNLEKGRYYFRFSDNSFQSNKRYFNLPDDHKSVISLQKKSSVKLSIQGESGQIITKGVRLNRYHLNFRREVPLENIDQNYFEFIPELRNGIRKNLYYMLEAEGYYPEKIGPFLKTWEGVKEIQIDLKLSSKFEISLIDNSTGDFMPSTPIELWAFGQKLSVLTTDRNGELQAYMPNRIFDIKVNKKGFAPFIYHYLKSSKGKIQMELIKGGFIKGSIEMDDKTESATIYLYQKSQKFYQGANIQIKNNVYEYSFEHIKPGEYKMLIAFRKKNNSIEKKNIQKKILIQNEKVSIIDLIP